MPLELYIHPCIHDPRHHPHPPPFNYPLRIRIQGPLESIKKLLPSAPWHQIGSFPQTGGIELAHLTHEALYGRTESPERNRCVIVRDEYLAWAMVGRRELDYIDYYGVTFDHLVPADDPDPEVLVINIIELDDDGGVYADGGKYAREVLPVSVYPADYSGKKVLAVPRCCQHKKGTQDRKLINSLVAERDNK